MFSKKSVIKNKIFLTIKIFTYTPKYEILTFISPKIIQGFIKHCFITVI